MSSTPLFRAVLLAAALVSLCACGRRGALEPPPNPNAVQTPAPNHGLQANRPSQKITPPNKPFALDPLLQ